MSFPGPIGTNPSQGHVVHHYRQSLQPHQCQNPYLAGRSSPYPARPIPKGDAWLNLQEGWWRLLRREALAGQTFADYLEIEQAAAVATHQLTGALSLGSGADPTIRLAKSGDFIYIVFKELSSKEGWELVSTESRIEDGDTRQIYFFSSVPWHRSLYLGKKARPSLSAPVCQGRYITHRSCCTP